MKICISLGNCDKTFFYINLLFILQFILIIIAFYIYYDFKGAKIYNNILIPFSYYFGRLLCLIPEYIIKSCFKKEKNLTQKKSNIKYIYNDQLKNIKCSDILKIIGISILSLIQTLFYLYLLIVIFIDNDNSQNDEKKDNINDNRLPFYGIISCIFILNFILSKFILKRNYYNHHYFSICIITIIGLIKFFYYEYLKGEGISDIILDIIIILILSLINSSTSVYKKFLIEKKYFSIYKTCYIFGFINIIIIIIINLIVSSLSGVCKSEENCYVLKIKSFFNELISIKVTMYLTLSIFSGIFGITVNYILTNYSPFHLILPLALFMFIIEIFSIIKSLNNIINILIFLLYIFEFILILVFLEIIELNFCGLSKNTKKNIRIRCKNDINYSLVEDDNFSDISFEEEEEKNIIKEKMDLENENIY